MPTHTESLRGPVGTSVVMSIPDIPRGSEGNPTSATILPTLNVGRMVDSTVTTTGVLRDPGFPISGTTPSLSGDPATQAYIDAQHKRALDALTDHERTMREFGKDLIAQIVQAVRAPQPDPTQASSSRPSSSRSPPPPPRPPSSDDESDSDFRAPPSSPPHRQFNRDELMSLLYADLLAEATARGQPEDDLMGLLRRNLIIPTVTRHEFDVFRTDVDQRLSAMEKKQADKADEILGAITALRTEIQQSCRPAVSARAPRHDQDDPGSAPHRPEGETRRRVTRTSRTGSTAPSTAATPTSAPTTTRTQHMPIPSVSRVNTPTVEKPEEDITFENTSRAGETESDEELVDIQHLRDSVKSWFKDPYESVLQEQDYVNLRHAEANYVQGNTSTPNLLPHQIRWQRVLNEAKSKWVNPQFRAPYLEEIMEKIFRKTNKAEDLAHIHLVMEMDQPKVREYVHMLKMRARKASEVVSRHPIVGIMQIGSDKIFQVEYPTFKVRRKDGNIYTFSEADFACLDILDFETLYTELKEKTKRNREEKLAYRALVRHVQKELRYSYLHDLQRAVESGQRKVHMMKPNQKFPGLEEHPVTTVLTYPAYGVVWMHAKGDKRFLRFDEIAAYSDGTLSGIRNRLHAELSADKWNTERMRATRRNSIIEAIEVIDKRILFRQTLRRFEGMFELKRQFCPKGGDC